MIFDLEIIFESPTLSLFEKALQKNIFVFWLSVRLGHTILTTRPWSILPWITLMPQCSKIAIMIQKFKNGKGVSSKPSGKYIHTGTVGI